MLVQDVATLGQAVRAARRRHKMSQTELALVAGVGPRFVVELENGKEKIPDPVLYYWGVDTETRRWQRVATYGGRLTQNFAEGIARDLLVNGLQNLEAAGYPPIGSVHDEGLFEPAETHGSFEEAKKLFLTAPKWSAGLPLNAAGFRSKRYRK